MVIELFILFEILTILAFLWGFVGKNKIVWTISFVLAATMCFQSFNVETWVYTWNVSINAYSPVLVSSSYIWLMSINLLFLLLSLVLGLYDLYEELQSGKRIVNMRDDQN